jgi:carboxyl-terminal processing protease
MNRRIPILFLALAVLTPGLRAQQPASATRLPSGDEADVFTSALHAIASMHMNAPSDSLLLAGAIHGMIESLNDPYAEVYTQNQAKAFDEETTGSYSGVGLTIQELNDRVTVTAVFRKTPAKQAGIQLGDQIVGVNDHDATAWTTNMAADSIKGPVGTTVKLKIARPGYSEPFTFALQRDSVHVPAVSYGVLDGNIGYVVLDRVARNAAREMNGALQQLRNTHGLIIDLRGNPGGFLDESLMLADLFLPPGDTLASTRQRIPGGTKSQVETEAYEARIPARVPDLPIVMLVDRYTASGAEIFAGALQDYDRALILGERSFGKGVMQTVMPLPHGQRLKFTTGTWLTPLGRSLHRPRGLDGQPLPEDTDTLPVVKTASGRTLRAGGGIFPDLPIKADTLTLAQRAMLKAAGEAHFPLGQKISEFALTTAKSLIKDSAQASLSPDSLNAWIDRLVSQGLPASAVNAAPGVRDYLAWQARMAVAERMDEVGREAKIRMEHDPVLSEAVHLLESVKTQDQLFAAADKERAAEGAQRTTKVGANR